MAAVEIADLNDDERVALLALLQRVVAADGRVSEEEREEIEELVEAFGEDGYRAAVDAAAHRFEDTDVLKRQLIEMGKKPERSDARELIMGLLLEASIPLAIEGHEPEIIGWLSDTWKIETHFEDQAED
jgi:uncharacterized tellurite resistance protein B-like protein